MAVFDIGIFEHFSIIFPFLLVWTISFAILSFSEKFRDNKNLNAIISLSLAFIFVMSQDAIDILNLASPWFVLLFIFILFIIIAFKVLGVSDDRIREVVTGGEYEHLTTWIIVIAIIIIFLSGSSVLGQRMLNKQFEEGEATNISSGEGGVGSAEHEEAWTETLFHPKVLGMIIMLIIASLTIKQLTTVPG